MTDSTASNPLHLLVGLRAHAHAVHGLPRAPQGRSVQRLWTVLDKDSVLAHGPVHNINAFLEDRGQDWDLDRNGRLRFFSRIVAQGEEVEVIVDFETEREREARMVGAGGFQPLPKARRPVGSR